ncbi:hypothetical protein [Mycolicibacterium fortuitum]|uniref:Uncharacterized protein n=1 Tax=Mycolicibacterium fortuitum subsp. fortuitum DSM 46621 = ATCC 6841 = JCM 6387 TaxID=1214102 RepID=K0VLD5_MYCFO|nr:hypothetical protein [Mycolicibacterium fortuitum]CRL79619.1 hypothetical protein CPGR_02814 [Mycolicibacter nonchromogenicus]EJZ15783.1 hypothetical protein MFORT_02699 [Mycolicibacterium fortuitum subsp. fortuitum DSM 46621 = ATCC 6841 = JCM 6387]WEV33449.1 hypothetical protein OMF10_03260 [Mycolicibacterium fortuitum]CRL54792.1 hypothetical protein CPGR_02089 [Mycolicibacterium fortuitum subsp. fortuitum DSM 46621 = ATCC 6841 = JCM 6387]BDD96557.1 hypothetical protein MFTT_06510 [Mycolic
MSVLQLIRGETQGLEPLPNPEQLQPAQIFRESGNAFLAGSDDLIFIAYHLSHRGYRVLDFYIVNRFFVPIEEEEREWLSEELIRLIESGRLKAIHKFIERHLDGRFVEQVRLHSYVTDNNITIAQQGVVHANDEDVAPLRKGLDGVNKTL